MSSNATAATARRITTALRAATACTFRTSSQGPYVYRAVLHTTANDESVIARLAVGRMLQMGYDATSGRDQRTGRLVITVVDTEVREQTIQEQEERRAAALDTAWEETFGAPRPVEATEEQAATLVAPAAELDGELRHDEHGARYWTAEELAAEAQAVTETTVEQWGPDAVAVTRQYNEPAYGCVQHIERGPECGPDCDELTAQQASVAVAQQERATRGLLTREALRGLARLANPVD